MAAPALQHDLRNEATMEDLRGQTSRSRTSRDAGAVVRNSAVAMPRSVPRTAPRTAPRISPREDEATEADEHRVAARRRIARRGHQNRTLPRVPLLAATLILGQIFFLLYVTGLGMAATHADADLAKRIAAANEEIKQSQAEISKATSKPRMEKWARELGLRRVQPSDNVIDRVSAQARPTDLSFEGTVR